MRDATRGENRLDTRFPRASQFVRLGNEEARVDRVSEKWPFLPLDGKQ